MENNTSRINVSTILPIDYIEMGNQHAKETLLVLHGFAQNNEQIKEMLVEKLAKEVLEKYRILIPNGLLPIPKIRPKIIHYRYSWYFYDHSKGQYHIDMQAPIMALNGLLAGLNISAQDVTLLGYSQGGYLAPIMASKTSGLKASIAINANTRVDKLGEFKDFKHLSIHNEGDPIVEFDNSYKSYESMKEEIPNTSFQSFKIDSHEIHQENIDAVSSFLLEVKE